MSCVTVLTFYSSAAMTIDKHVVHKRKRVLYFTITDGRTADRIDQFVCWSITIKC